MSQAQGRNDILRPVDLSALPRVRAMLVVNGPGQKAVGMQVGDVVDDFELFDEQGAARTLSGLLENGPVVLFFYPAAMSAGCTVEACHFRDVASEFQALGAQPVGISGDEISKQAQFAAKHQLGYPLLSDPDGTVRTMFGVKRSISITPTKRATFVIDTDRRVLEIVNSELRMNAHADKALEALRARAAR